MVDVDKRLIEVAHEFESACIDAGIETAKVIYESSTWAIGGYAELRLSYYDSNRKIHIWKEGEEWV